MSWFLLSRKKWSVWFCFLLSFVIHSKATLSCLLCVVHLLWGKAFSYSFLVPKPGGGSARRRSRIKLVIPSNVNLKVVCQFCDKPGHWKKDCPERAEWMRAKNEKSAAVTEPVLCCPAGQRTLPKFYVNVMVGEGEKKTVAVVDSGSTPTLVSKEAATMLGSSVRPHTQNLVGVNGTDVVISGAVVLSMERMDDHVKLPRVTIDALIVEELSAVNADILVGVDVISRVGGVSLKYGDNGLSDVLFGDHDTCPSDVDFVAMAVPVPKLSRHVNVAESGGNVSLDDDDFSVSWSESAQCWQVEWKWVNGVPPSSPIGSGIGEYSRKSLTPEQELQFQAEVNGWLENGWLEPYDCEKQGEIGAVLPLMAVLQEHKSTTPVRPVLDYRELNKRIVSNPGFESPVCGSSLRAWRQVNPDSVLLDVRKAYLQVHVHPSQVRYQVVVFNGQKFVMTRMGFGLSIAPKVMDTVIKYVTRDMPAVDNYIDDLRVPSAQASEVVQ